MNQPKPVLQVLKVNDLVIDPSYQRTAIRKSLVKTIIDTLDEGLLGQLIVNQRNGASKYYIIDGQHRMLALRHLKVPDVLCSVYAGLTPEEEADKFRQWNSKNNRRPTTPGENFKARLKAGEPVATKIANIVSNNGLKLAFCGGGAFKNTISSFITLERIYCKMGGDTLNRALKLLKETWDGEEASLQNGFLEGISYFVSLAGPILKDREFAAKLKKIDPNKIFREADGLARFSKSRSQNFAKVFTFYYNKQRQFDKIPEELFTA